MSGFHESDNGGGSHSATDIITYIGVPLAVLGVLPILYNTAVTLAALSRIKRMLRHSRLPALTRSDVVNRIIEVELPRYAVRPMDRFTDRQEYWSVSSHRSSIPGGSWTTFNWRTNVIGLNTQRVEYADQLRQPQVEVEFDQLVCYLLDLGAVPDGYGWRMLRGSGLWTPVGCTLMTGPGGKKALSVGPLDGSDGHLSLVVNWEGGWTRRSWGDLPPYWVRLPPPPPPRVVEGEEEGGESMEEVVTGGEHASCESLHKTETETSRPRTQQKKSGESSIPITCQISTEGIVTALRQEAQLTSTINLDSLPVDHIRVRSSSSSGAWFASAATAYGTTSQTILWSYKIPDDILTFSRKETVPCGVLVLLNVVEQSATPEWATTYNDGAADLDKFTARMRDQRAAMAAEAKLPPAQRAQAAMERVRRENEMRMQDMKDQQRLRTARQEARLLEALQSPKWDTKLVAEHNLTWLKNQSSSNPKEKVAPNMEMKEVVGTLLYRMVLDSQFTAKLCTMLELWKNWAENGGMRKSDLERLREEQVVWAYATLLVAMIKDCTGLAEGTLALDLQECLRVWRNVRLG
ncbi:uncharacterized protein PODANS_4_6810 [Podospora anserina S mat+]|uniref:Podospora anserina S mat+ genomic DNA chromosome 4, supercontig 4 n=1 Tax=Podospora anserina (strain S / ATCC MYA-4624 / DSM 980 / FGSC 10383) TaxID=515849 RepID=B2ARP6_PODAN|nr:uncharacterized protein PODANS_4_6810 [Podospora anserina S mat+]CAP66824.1 unnamed protein product [Podospora anserina S mat+]CDP28566.1 Putative protein of unknown function [Podospora anserina S mat+]